MTTFVRSLVYYVIGGVLFALFATFMLIRLTTVTDDIADVAEETNKVTEALINIAEINRANGEHIKQCTTAPPPGIRYACAEFVERNRSQAVFEINCHARRLAAGLPALPEPPIDTPLPQLARWCRDHTPPEIYPGVAKE